MLSISRHSFAGTGASNVVAESCASPDRFADYPAATSQRKLFAALADPQKRLF
jgi:hypothetical protein